MRSLLRILEGFQEAFIEKMAIGSTLGVLAAQSTVSTLSAQSSDTALAALHTRNFFFNVVAEKDGRVYAGSSDGVFEMRETEPRRLDGRVGYLKTGKYGKPEIDSNGMRYIDQKTFLHLLPYPSEKRDETHAYKDRFLYIVSGGCMYVFEIRPYGFSYRNHSIRSITKNLVGTYSGVYHRGKRLPDPAFPGFTDGYIRELNGKVFIPFDSLNVYDIDPTDSSLIPYRSLPAGMYHRSPYDIRYVPRAKKYFIATYKRLLSMDSTMKDWKTIHATDSSDGPIVITGQTPYTVFFADGRKLLFHNTNMLKGEIHAEMPEKVMDGAINGLYLYILCPSGLYLMKRAESMKKLVDLNRAHTLLVNRDGEFVIGTDVGLLHYDIQSGKLSTLVNGVEFNRRALALLDNRIHAGSINGMYIIDNQSLKELIRLNDENAGEANLLPGYALLLITVLLMATLGFAALYLRTRRKYEEIRDEPKATAETEAKPRLSREDIESFIRSDLSNASLKSIKERFQTNNVQIYKLLDPEKPGGFIHRLRMEIVQEMRAKGASAKDISQRTGLSESYVRTVWNK